MVFSVDLSPFRSLHDLHLSHEALCLVHMIFYVCLTLSGIGTLGHRGAVGARHNGFPHTLSPLLSVVCHGGLNLSEGFAGALRDVVSPGLFRPAPFFACLRQFPLSLLFSIQSSMSDNRHTIYSVASIFT